MSDNVILEVKDLHKYYEKQEVLKGISTTVRKGDVIAIIGPSGCGKSTFLRSLNLLEVPTKGQILFEGTDITEKKTDINQMRRKIGMVFQQFNLFPNMTIRENIMLAPVKLKLMTKEQASAKAEELLARIRAILRSSEKAAEKAPEQAEKEEDGSILSCSGVEMNTDSHEVTYNGQPVELTNREFILLRTLMENKNVAMTREKLLCDAWGYDYYGETNIIDVYVRYIRHKTSDDVIKTIRGVGYIVSDN